MAFPFSASAPSSTDLLRAVSTWLYDFGHPDVVPSAAGPTSYSIPMVYSHSEWFAQCVPALGAELSRLQNAADESANGPNATICAVMRLALGLTVRVPMRDRCREEMGTFIETFVALLRCAEQPAETHPRRLAQKAFVVLLNRFEPVAQFLVLSRIFQMVFSREIIISRPEHEPHLLAWLTDIYRTKCYGGTEDESAICRGLFRQELGHFCAQIQEVVYEDPPVAVNFYVAVCLLFSAQAMRRHRVGLLRSIGLQWVRKVKEQIGDWLEVERAREEVRKEAAETGQKGDSMAITKNVLLIGAEKSHLSMIDFQLDETEWRISEVISHE